jgi:23S rRNA (uridine2552-2'-O)-methyltransferase
VGRSKSSGRWLREHFDDEYVSRARSEGYKSRAVYKLKELDEKDAIFDQAMTVVDLGAAPGSWSQYVVERVGTAGKVIASDLLPMESMPGVVFIEGDFTDSAILGEILAAVGSEQVDVVISDIAPNISGVSVVDQSRSIYLAEMVLAFSREVLKPGGTLLVKMFQGEGYDGYLQGLRGDFGRVLSRKPKASRGRSREVYILARDMKL